MAKTIKELGKRKKAPIALKILWICLFVVFIQFDVLIFIVLPEEMVFAVVCFIILLLGLILEISSLVVTVKTWKNELPLAKYSEKDEEIEFYSILSTSLKIKKESIYRIHVSLSGQISVFFYNDINQKLVLNTGYFEDAKKLKEELKKIIGKDIK